MFSGLYIRAAILHFLVSAVPAACMLAGCGGSGRGLPADTRLHIFLEFFFSPLRSGFYSPRPKWTDLLC